MAYTGSVELISGIKQKNNGTFPLVDASAVRVDDATRLDAALNAKHPKQNLVFVDELPASGQPNNIYMVPNTSGTGYEKWWWIKDENNVYKWDVFGGSATLVVDDLEEVTTPDADIDYIVKISSSPVKYALYKYINESWVIIDAGNSAAINTIQSTLNSQNTRLTNAETTINGMRNNVASVTEGDSAGIVVTDNNGTSTQVDTKDSRLGDVLRAVAEIEQNENGFTVTYTDNDTDTIEIQGGGGGGQTSGEVKINYVDGVNSIQCIYGDDVTISYEFSAKDDGGDTVGDGSIATWYVKGVKKATSVANNGTNTFNIGPYLSAGNNDVRVSITVNTGGATPVTKTKPWTVNAINMYVDWTYNDTTINSEDTFILYWKPIGSIAKTTHFVFDGDTEHEVTYTPSNPVVSTQQNLEFESLSHGHHMVEVYLTAELNDGTEIQSASVFHDMIFVDGVSTAPVVATSFVDTNVLQYDTVQIPFVVYDPESPIAASSVTLAVGGTTVSTLTNVDGSVHYWNYSPTTTGTVVLTITCGTTTRTITLTVEELDIDNEEVSSYTFKLKASELAGNDALQSWSSNGVTATFSNNFDFENGGIKSEIDENGNPRQFICIKSGTRMTIDYNLFGTDPTVYGRSFKMIFKTTNCKEYDAQIFDCYADNIGIKMTANDALFQSSGHSLTTSYCEDEYIELEFDVYRSDDETPLMMAWLDGVITTARVYTAGQGGDNFVQTAANRKKLIIGSDDCDVYIYLVKVYPFIVTIDGHMSNFIADAPNAQEMVRRYNRNDILGENSQIDYTLLAEKNPDCRVWLYDIPYLSNGKKDKVSGCQFQQIWTNGDQYYQLSGTGTITIQGTSSVEYILGAANTDINFSILQDGNGNNLLLNGVKDDTYGNNIYEGENGSVKIYNAVEGQTLGAECIPIERDASGNVTKYIRALGYKVNNGSTPISYSNTKVNFASCEQVNNMCNALWYQRFQPYPSLTPRDCMEFSMGVMFIKDSGTIPDAEHFILFGDDDYHMYSIANMGTSKKNVHVFHDLTNENDVCIEVNNNTNALCRMVKSAGMTDAQFEASIDAVDWSGKTDGADHSFGMRFPDVSNPSAAIKNAWKRLVMWMGTNNPADATGAALATPETYGNYTFRGHNRPIKAVDGQHYEQVLKGTTITTYAGTYTHDTFNRRMAKMLSECEDYLVMDSLVYHFVYLERHTMIDNVSKNNFWSSSDLLHWDMSKAYDMDTSDGNNNSGRLVFDYGDEPLDNGIFNARDSVWWVFINGLKDACKTMYINRNSHSAWSPQGYHEFLTTEQRKVPERVWNECYWYDYIRTYGINSSWLEFLDGGQKVHQRNHYETYEGIYDASKYQANESDFVSFRATTPTVPTDPNDPNYSERTQIAQSLSVVPPSATISLKAYNKCYINVDIDGNVVPTKCLRGQTYNIDLSSISETFSDSVSKIYPASMLQEISNIAPLYPHVPMFGLASRIRVLELSSPLTGYYNNGISTLSFGSNKMLEYLYVPNLPKATGILDLGECSNLKYIDASNSPFSGFSFAEACPLEEVYVDAPLNLSMRKLVNLTYENFHIASYEALTNIAFEDIDDSITLDAATSAPLQMATILGLNWRIPNTTVLEKLYNVQSRTLNGVIDHATLSGYVLVFNQIEQGEYDKYEEAWQSLTVEAQGGIISQYQAKFINRDGTVLGTWYFNNGTAPSYQGSSDPTIEADERYTYTFNGWAVTKINGSTVQNPVTHAGTEQDPLGTFTVPIEVTAQYTLTAQQYTVTWYAGYGSQLAQLSNVPYGSECVYNNGSPLILTSSNTTFYTNGTPVHPSADTLAAQGDYYLFAGWDRSTGFIRGDTNVYAIWKHANHVEALNTDMQNVNPEVIYAAMCSLKNNQVNSDYYSERDYTDITLGNDFDFSGSAYPYEETSNGIVQSVTVVGGNSRPTFHFHNGQGGYLDTGIDLFNGGDRSFTIAIDYQYLGSQPAGATVISAYTYGNGSDQDKGFRLYTPSLNSRPTLQYQGLSQIVGDVNSTTSGGTTTYNYYREILVIRHEAGTGRIVFYYPTNVSGSTQTRFHTQVEKSTATYSGADVTHANLILGGYKSSSTNTYVGNTGSGMIRWCKVWYDDIGDCNAKLLAYWPHEKVRFEYTPGGRYMYTGSETQYCMASFVANNELAERGYYMNSSNTNANGWNGCLMRNWLNTRFYYAMPEIWRSMIKSVKIKATAGSQSSSIVTSDDKIYLLSYTEVGAGSASTVPYCNEGAIYSWFVANTPRGYTANGSRIKWRGLIIKDDATYYTAGSNPLNNDMELIEGDIWINSSNQSIGYMYMERETIDMNGLTVAALTGTTGGETYDTTNGDWIQSAYWWTRSPSATYSTTFTTVPTTGTVTSTTASYVSGVVPGLSI